MAVVEFREGDTMGRLVVEFWDPELDAAIPISGGTPKMSLSVNGAAYVEKTLTVLTPPGTDGKAYYQWLATDLAAGKAVAVPYLTDTGGFIGTDLDEIEIKVLPKRRTT